ncbi:MAG TPA: hypothetical protein DDY91_11480 [Planctomycetaceae bacterium]|nr:hypothetical protein [Planctomycetaceae bacterium]
MVDEYRRISAGWEDKHDLAGREPFVISITGREDDAMSMNCEELPRQKIVLDSATLGFKLHAPDDFGRRNFALVSTSTSPNSTEKTRHARWRQSAAALKIGKPFTRSDLAARSRSVHSTT